MTRRQIVSIFSALCVAFLLPLLPQASQEAAPVPGNLLKAAVWKKILDEREIYVRSILGDAEVQSGSSVAAELKKYSFSAAMGVRAPVEKAKKSITDYRLYVRMVPYVEFAEYSEKTHILEIAGGIWKYKMASSILFEEKTPHWIHFKVIRGHFLGLEGDLVFHLASASEKSFGKDKDLTVIFVQGLHWGSVWPPRFVMEKGAEIVFEFTARRMRSYIESNVTQVEGATYEVFKKDGKKG